MTISRIYLSKSGQFTGRLFRSISGVRNYVEETEQLRGKGVLGWRGVLAALERARRALAVRRAGVAVAAARVAKASEERARSLICMSQGWRGLNVCCGLLECRTFSSALPFILLDGPCIIEDLLGSVGGMSKS